MFLFAECNLANIVTPSYSQPLPYFEMTGHLTAIIVGRELEPLRYVGSHGPPVVPFESAPQHLVLSIR